MPDLSLSIRTKLIGIFILIKVLPLIALAWFAWHAIFNLAAALEGKVDKMVSDTRNVAMGIGDMAAENSIKALDHRSREAIEHLTTDTARRVADFLYDRDRDIELAARLAPGRDMYRRFLSARARPVVIDDDRWVMDAEGKSWIRKNADIHETPDVKAQNDDNRHDFHYRPPEAATRVDNRPLYLEMTYIDPTGMEKYKVTTSDLMDNRLLDVSKKENTFCKAETYFQALKKLKPGDIYVSEVIGAYVKGQLIGVYSKTRAEAAGIAFTPEASAYAGKENPVGIRFRGLIRWGAPVTVDDHIVGYVTLALDHTHIMEFTDHMVPTAERYCAISDAGTGNYAFMWDYEGRNISHPRDYFIVGYDPETGGQAVPWLEKSLYPIWRANGSSMERFEKAVPWFKDQSLKKKPASELTRQGYLGLDGRFLNFAPQCGGWHNLTQNGGSGSFLIFWSGLWKLTTAATIPYYTGIYGDHPRGFGYVTIGANVDEFHKPAMETASRIKSMEAGFEADLREQQRKTQSLIHANLRETSTKLALYTFIMIVIVIAIAMCMAGALTKKITEMILGIKQFQEGDRSLRLKQKSRDEMGQLAFAFNEMADKIQQYVEGMESAKAAAEDANTRLEMEIVERQTAQEDLARHRDHLEDMVKERTGELEKEILERKRIEKAQDETEQRLKQQNEAMLRLAGHEILYKGDLEESMKVILHFAARTLYVRMASYWEYSEKKALLRCVDIYDLNLDRYTKGGKFSVADHPQCLKKFRDSRTIPVPDVISGRRNLGILNIFSVLKDTTSMLLATVFEDGEMVGAVSFEHSGGFRNWHLDEQNFARSISDMVSMAIGVSKRVIADRSRQALETRLHRAEKMEAIGTLAGGVAHDLNNLLTGLVSYPELLRMKLPDDSPMIKPIETIINSGRRASAVVEDLLTLARRGVSVTEIVNLNTIIAEHLQSIEHEKLLSDHPGVNLKTVFDPNLMNIKGSSVHLSKTVMNLITNAAEAMTGGGELTISTQNRYIDRPIRGYDNVAEGDYATLTVTDTGTGISPEDMGRIFEPFYTRKKMGRSGTGLGMAVVWGTVKDHNGYIDFESSQGQGTRFTLYFPVTRKQMENEVISPALDAYRGNNESILLVDDVEEQREIASLILTELNYRVTAVSSGEAAVEYLKKTPVDLLVLDMIMDPGMDGLDTYRQVLQISPRQKAVVVSGFSETDRIREAIRLGVGQNVKKPYSIEKLGLAIKKELEK